MIHLRQLVILIFSLALMSSTSLIGQQGATAIEYNLSRVNDDLSVSKMELTSATSLADLNRFYKPEWVREYISVEISSIHQGQIKKSRSKDGNLSVSQKEQMLSADAGKDIVVHVRYVPENDLKKNESRDWKFTFTIDPEREAQYPDGDKAMLAYLKKSTVDNIPAGCLTGYQLAAIKFTVNEEGEIINPFVFESTKDEKVDKMLLAAICDMPNWTPAQYADGTRVAQDFAFSVGNMESCIVNLLSVK